MKRLLLYLSVLLLHLAATAQENPGSDLTEGELGGTTLADTGSMTFSAIYPNPANNEATIDYKLKAGQTGVSFVLYDLLGTKVKDIEISEIKGSLKLNTSGLTEGIYFYSLLINNESFLTQKLIVKH